MDAQEFLARVVAPGAYYAFAYKPPGATGLRHKFFPQDKVDDAVLWLRETAKTCDVWHAVASFKTRANRKQDNAEALRCFWYDADIKRDGDGKAPGDAWATLLELMEWLIRVKDELPVPNLWIASGYGVHLYWVLDEAIPAADWMVHARAFRDLLKRLGARGDIGISANSACILRPPETFNFKVPHKPAGVADATPSRARYNFPTHFVTKDFLARLTPGVTSLGPKPNRPVNTGSLAAAKANLSKPPPSDFKLVASRCLQVKKSLEEEGEHDRYLLWHAMINLAYFCDSPEAAHDLGRKGVGYSVEDTNKKFDMTAQEHADKRSFGAPSCDTFDMHRPGVCEHCEFRDKVKTPYRLGWVENTADLILPTGYKRELDALWHRVDGKWELLIKGNVSSEQLFYLGPGVGFQFAFDHELNGHVSHIRVDEAKITGAADKVRALFVPMGLSLNRFNAVKFSEFVVAWITKLKEALQFTNAPPSFGWDRNDQGYQGVAIAGTYYRTDGTEGLAQSGDKTIHENYQPSGDIKLWRRACEYVIGDQPELHVVVGASFGAPLMELVGQSGILSHWSQLSGARKTSTFRVATAVWCNPITGMSALKDTPNSVMQSLAETKIMPVFWDEIHVSNKDQVAPTVDMIFNITQGRGKSRLDQRINQRPVGHWYTLMFLGGNKPNAEMIEQDRPGTDAGAVRVFEYELKPLGGKADPDASSIVQSVEHNYGHAGRIYIRWVVDNLNEVQKLIKGINDKVYKDIPDLGAEERFHVASIVGVVAGAMIANKIGLVKLDVRGVYKFLVSKLRDIRIKRQEDNPTDPVEFLSKWFEKFITDHRDVCLLVSQSFSKQGRRAVSASNQHPVSPPFGGKALIHIGIEDQELRFEQNTFIKWCRANGQAHTFLLQQMKDLWSVTRTRAVLAVGTPHIAGQVHYYRLMLTRPELQHHLTTWGASAPLPANVVPFPAAE